jgi:preprotein translocase subunit YajC
VRSAHPTEPVPTARVGPDRTADLIMQLLLIYIVVIGGVFLFMTTRGNKRRQSQAAQLQAALIVGAEVRTIGGLVGEVIEVTDEYVLVETTPGVKLRFVKSAVAGVVSPAEAEPEAASGDEESEAESEPRDSVESEAEAGTGESAAAGESSAEDAPQNAQPVKS